MELNKRTIAERFSRLSQNKQGAFLEALRQQEIDFAQLPIVSRAEQEACPLSYAQLRQWFLWRLDPDGSAYHITGALRLAGRLQRDALRDSFAALAARHEALRTVFREDGEGGVSQHVQAEGKVTLQEVDLTRAAETERQMILDEQIAHLCDTPFDLEQGPLLRVGLLRVAGDEHLLIVVMHHIIADGWSMQLIVDEFAADYRARAMGDAACALPALSIQYADYAVWQRQWMEAGEKERQLAYWRSELGDSHPVLQLPTDRPRRQDGGYRAARHRWMLPASLGNGLRQRAQAQGATLFMALLTAFQVLLHRYTGQAEIRVGVPIANRHRTETQGVVGLFVNTQVLRNPLNGRLSLDEALAQGKRAALGAQAHQDLPFEQLVEALQPERSLNHSPLFQVMFNHQYQDHHALHDLPGLILETRSLERQTAQYELTLDTLEREDGRLEASFTYAQELFDTATIERLAGHYLTLLHALAESPQQALGDVDLLGEAEHRQLTDWGGSPHRSSTSEPVHCLIERQAEMTPEATALVFDDQRLSYAELNTRANCLAHYLIGLGVKPDTRVGIAVERSIEMVVGLLGILKAGGAYVPLDPDYPIERLAYMVKDSGIELLIIQQHLRDILPVTESLNVIELDWLDVTQHASTNPDVALHGEHLAYVIYTSGSTGRPKGVGVNHGPLAMHLQAAGDRYGLMPEDRLLQFASISFDAAGEQWLLPLLAGAALVLPQGRHLAPDTLASLVRKHAVSVLYLPPVYLRYLHQSLRPGALPVRLCIAGGEAWSRDDFEGIRRTCQPERLFNAYGPAETVISPTLWAEEDGLGQSAQVPIGRPIGERKALVLDANLNLMPAGVPGELYLGGEGLARGYLHRPGLTAERFIADPFGSGGRLYRTGDRVRWRDDGQLEYLGRLDHQVKIRGLRIELGEVEAELLAQPAVREAVVVAQDGPDGARLVAYVVLRTDNELDTAQLRERLAQRLPDYMVPGIMVTLDALPLSPNGKVDRKALPEPDLASGASYEPPQGEVEASLAAIWADVLGVERVGRHDSFFELGGHSLLALTVLERMRGQGWTAEVRTLFQWPELAAFAQAIAQQPERSEIVIPPNRIPDDCQAIQPAMLTLVELETEEIEAIEAAVPGGAANIQDIYPLAPLQEGILFHHRLQQQGDAYVTPHLLGFDSRERLEGFIAGFNRLIVRHDILRTAVLWEGLREPVQVVSRHAELELEWWEEDGSPNTAERLSAYVDPRHQRIDVRRAPMLRAVAVHDAEQGRWLLQLPSHHLVMDHTTLELLVEEIALIQQGREAALPKPLPFRNFLAQARLGVSQEEHEAFFRDRLGDVKETTAPFGLLDVRGDGGDIEETRLPLEGELARQVRQQAKRHGVSTASLFHLAWALVLSKTTGRNDVVFGTVLFGRMQGKEGAERALGMFINTLPVRLETGGRGIEECLHRTHATLSELLHHEHASLALAQRCSGLPGGTPLFTSLLNYRYSAPRQEENPVHAWEGMEVLGGQERTNYPVTMAVDDLGNGFQLVGQVSRTVGARRLCDYMGAAVAGIVAALQTESQHAVSEISLLGVEERRQLSEWGENPARHAESELVHRLIERQAGMTPEATALVFDDQRLSYAELNTRANQLAHYLIGRGVKPETRVGIAMERSIELVVGLLGILKAGGAYVPLDPDYPTERLAYMIADSGLDLLLTQQHLREALPVTEGLDVLELDRLDVTSSAATDPGVALHSEHLAYVIYTSGSTGRPKGAAIRHGALANCMIWMQQTYRLTDTDTVLHKAPFSFDVSVWEIFWPLSVGARLVVSRPGDHRDPGRIVDLVQRHGITTLNFVPSMLQAFLDYPDVGSRTRLKHIMCGGEAVPAALQQAVFERLDGANLHDLYGPTEATIHATHWWCRDETQRQIPIGRPINDTCAYVLDDELNLLPAGVSGELYLGGECLARGYLHRPGLTAERFVADPFGAGGRLYRTGDRARWLDEGQLEYLGRLDHQVKIRGLRIELAEIDAELLAQPEVREAAVMAWEGSGGSRLVAYVVPRADSELDTARLRERLGQRLPDYMVPGVMITLDALPLSPNGKVDRKALPEPDLASGLSYEPPQGEVEETLAAIWAEVLGIERVGRHDNFFELGGHSLLAVQLASRVYQAWSAELAIQDVFQFPELAGQAAHIATLAAGFDTNLALDEIDAFIDTLDSVK